MSGLSDENLRRLRDVADLPEPPSDRYEVIERVAAGGMGTVYRARDRELNRDVALKILSAAGPTPSACARMLREARVLARLEHPGIVPVHDVGTLSDGRVWYAMKLVRGRRLDEHVARVDDVGARLRIFERICDAVAFAHANGVIHRDLKPSNVMVGPFGEVLVMDWGIAKLADDAASEAADGVDSGRVAEQTRDGAVLGTPGYMAPEQEQGRTELVDARTDVYALGALLRDLAGGDGRPLPRRLLAIVERAGAARREDRYASVQDLAADVARFSSGATVTAYRESFGERVGRLVSRHRTAILLVVAYVVMRLLFLVFAKA